MVSNNPQKWKPIKVFKTGNKQIFPRDDWTYYIGGSEVPSVQNSGYCLSEYNTNVSSKLFSCSVFIILDFKIREFILHVCITSIDEILFRNNNSWRISLGGSYLVDILTSRGHSHLTWPFLPHMTFTTSHTFQMRSPLLHDHSHLKWAFSPCVHLALSPPCENNIFYLAWKNSQKSHEATPIPSIPLTSHQWCNTDIYFLGTSFVVISNINEEGSPHFTAIGPDEQTMGVLCERSNSINSSFSW